MIVEWQGQAEDLQSFSDVGLWEYLEQLRDEQHYSNNPMAVAHEEWRVNVEINRRGLLEPGQVEE